ncbi:imelysin family protein [Thalassovita taeanensis]|uniref:Imelysin-like domain-containing protein n=1 Tax=Thalassovita taeanensis TaxID=657014 RepID=A0A1H9JXS7_9RHOB|nr:imelysin family protein [Thalassovita taeanensis]SEQ91325.1 hypothetical protein SAMN04488092_11669 [Thalassovita taeanensis]
MRRLILLFLLILPTSLPAQDHGDRIRDVVDHHILPGFEALADTTAALAQQAEADCTAADPLRQAYTTAFDAWMGVSHLRFGPTEVQDRAFALAFWPDPRGATPKSLGNLIRAEDQAVASPDSFATVSIAARGFYALEFLLYDPTFETMGTPTYRCALIRAISRDIAATSADILTDWRDHYAGLMLSPHPDSLYHAQDEVLRELFKAVTTGLQVTSENRLGRPLGTFDKPRPKRAELRRSGRSLHQVILSLTATRDMALRLAGPDTALNARLTATFDDTLAKATALDDPIFAGVSDPLLRFRIEILQQSIDHLREVLLSDLGPTLGVSAGFNAMDGD